MNYQTEDMVKDLIDDINESQHEIAKAEKIIENAKKKIFDALEKNELETITVGQEDMVTKVTIVRPTTLKFNEEGLKENLSDAQWRQITKSVIDKKKVEDAIARGKIDISVISANSVEVASQPYLRITSAK